MSPSRSTTRNRISLASGAGSQGSPIGVIGAIVLHLAIVGAMFFTWQHRLDIVQESPPVVPVDLVTIAQKTNIAPTVQRETKLEPKPLPQPPPPDLVAQTPPLPQETEPAPQPVVKPQPAPKPVPEKDKMAEILNHLTAPKAEPKKPNKDNLAQILNNLTAPQPQQHAKISKTTHTGAGLQSAMNMELADAVLNQIREQHCWNESAFSGAPHPDQLVVYLDVSLNPNGTVAGAPQLTAESIAAESGNPFMRAAADAAVRAIVICAPFKLPPDRYAEWREFKMAFSPRDLAGQ